MPSYRDHLKNRLDSLAEELDDSVDGDTNDYVLRRYDEMVRLIQILGDEDRLESLSAGKSSGPYERITRGVT